MADIDLFKERFKKEILDKYGTIGRFAQREGAKLEKLGVDLRTIYRWTAAGNRYFPREDQRGEICEILNVNSDYLFPIPQNGLDANYYIGFLEGLLLLREDKPEFLLRGEIRKAPNLDQNSIVSVIDDDLVCNKFWKTLYAYKDKGIYEAIDDIWRKNVNLARPSLSELVFEKLFDDYAYREYFVELALLLVHYMGGKVNLFEQRVELAKKAGERAQELANEGSSRAEHFRSAYYLLNIDALCWIYLETGRFQEAIDVLEPISREIDSYKRPNTSALCQIFLARAYLLAGKLEDADKTLEEIDQSQITNELVRVRFYLVRGDHLLDQKGKFTAEAAFAVYSLGKELQEKLKIDVTTSGLGYRQGHVCVDMANALMQGQAHHKEHVKNTIQEQLLSSAESIFKNIAANYKEESADQLQALYGLARVSLARKDFSSARKQADEVITQCERMASGSSPHIVIQKAKKLIKEINDSQKQWA